MFYSDYEDDYIIEKKDKDKKDKKKKDENTNTSHHHRDDRNHTSSRSSRGGVRRDINELRAATERHIDDVANAMNYIADQLRNRGPRHDYTKMKHMQEYFDALNSPNFHSSNWRTFHASNERHHLKRHVPADVNIIDVIEHICDCTVSGMVRSRSGRILDTDIPPYVLEKAIQNTVNLIRNNVKVNYNESVFTQVEEDQIYYELSISGIGHNIGDEYIEESFIEDDNDLGNELIEMEDE